MIFITSVSSSKSLGSFTNCTFHLSRPPGFRRAFNANLSAFSAREVKRAVAEERDKYLSAKLQKNSESQCRRQSHPSKLSES